MEDSVDTEKTCTKCGHVGPPPEFVTDRSRCRNCRNAEARGHYRKRNPAEQSLPATHKTCSRCGHYGPLIDFYSERSECKPCFRAKANARYAANPEPRRAHGRANRARAREREQTRYERNPEPKRASVRRWQQANPEKVKARQHRRRALELSAPTIPFKPAELKARLSVFGFRCWICRVAPGTELDHVKPLSKGGWHCLSNLRPACVHCNRRKSDKWPFKPVRG